MKGMSSCHPPVKTINLWLLQLGASALVAVALAPKSALVAALQQVPCEMHCISVVSRIVSLLL